MKTPEWLKPGLYGAAIGAIALAIVGFGWGGWMTGGTANQMASKQARLEVVAALAPICVEQSKQDPQVAETLALLMDASSYQRSDMLMKAGQQLSAQRHAHESRLGHDARFKRSQSQRRQRVHGQAGRRVLAVSTNGFVLVEMVLFAGAILGNGIGPADTNQSPWNAKGVNRLL
jgi:hypothetical protein